MSKAANTQNAVGKLYQTVIDDVINNIRETFLDDGVDEQVLQELKQTWESKVVQTKAVENPEERRSHMPVYVYQGAGISNDNRQQHLVYQSVRGPGMTMSSAGQQATLALPNNVLFQQQQVTGNPHVFTSYQPQQVVRQTTTLPTTQSQGDPSQPSAIIQVDGADDRDLSNFPTTSKESDTIPRKHSKSRATRVKFTCRIPQCDGNADSSSESDDESEDDSEEEEEEKEVPEPVDEEPLCSDDDGTDEDPIELFDTENVVVCQYDKIHRTKCKWKFNLKVGIMNLNGKDHVFQKATGEAEW